MVRYEGAGGWVEIGPTTLTVFRADLRPDLLAPRVLPFQALSGVELKDATRLRRGQLHLWFGRGVLVPVGSDEDPNTIGFTYGQREEFRVLYEYLWNVVRTNDAQDVDVAAAYDAANDPLVAWLAGHERARERAEEERAAAKQAAKEKRAAAEQTAEEKRIARFVDRIGPEAAAREDIMTAGLASVTGAHCWLALKHLPGFLLGGEYVFLVAEGFFDGDLGAIVLTNQRLMFVKATFSGAEVSTLYLREIRTVARMQNTSRRTLQVESQRGHVVEFRCHKVEDFTLLDEALRQILGARERGKAARAATAAPPQDVIGQIARLGELHAAGVISTSEFEQKKQQLLDRL